MTNPAPTMLLSLLVVSGCVGLSSSFVPAARPSMGRACRLRPRSYQQPQHLRQQQLRMHLQADAVAEAMSQSIYILADASRGGAVVDQIPYVPGESVVDFDKIVIGSAACLGAYAWAAYEFGKRIATQRACEVCGGSGLVSKSRKGKKLRQPIKCYACGGFLPWQNWGRFWQSNMDVGNGGVLQRPANDYDELNEAARAAKKDRAADGDD